MSLKSAPGRFKRLAGRILRASRKKAGPPAGAKPGAEFDPKTLPPEERIAFLESKTAFLLDEVSGLRSLLRHVAADRIGDWPIVRETKESFDYQWGELPEGEAMPSNPAWKKTAADTICLYAGLPARWFAGKKILDAGCGQGRWTYGFGRLKAGACVSFDISENGVARTREIAREFGPAFTVQRKNILEDLGLPADFDLVWCFGVLHHTGNTYKGFQNLVRCVKPGGSLFLMIYGEPRPGHKVDYDYYHEMFALRTALRNLPLGEKVKALEERYPKDQVHGYFDAVSPPINDLYRWDELESWLVQAGFEDIRCTLPDHPNHFLVARRKMA